MKKETVSSPFPAFEKATSAQAELTAFHSQIQNLEAEKAGLTIDATLPPLKAANLFVTKEHEIDDALRQHRMALDLVTPSLAGLWVKALTELRPSIDDLDGKARSLADRVEAAVVRLLSPVTGSPQSAVSHNTTAIDAFGLVRDLDAALSSAVNSPPAEVIHKVIALHDAIVGAPARLKAIEDDLAKIESATVELERRFPAA